MNIFKFLAISSAIGVYILIVIGGITTQTGSGMACPDWPLCFGEFFPNLNINVIIEMTHRYVATFVGFLILFTFILAYRNHRTSKFLVISSGISLILVALQGYIGMLTVTSILDPAIVTLHLALSTALFGSSVITAILSLKTN
jgi:cytochrome c oxidase assembly protein subunit 15